jgi:hypothetical protein
VAGDFVRFALVPERSRVWTRSKSSFVPIAGQAKGMEGYVDLARGADGEPDLSFPGCARVELAVDRLSCGNPLYDWQLPRLVDARRNPKITGELVTVRPGRGRDRYRAEGDMVIAGTTCRVECEISVYMRDGVELEADWEQVVDIRDFDIDLPPLMRLRTYPEIDVRVHIEALRIDAFASESARIAV